MSPWFEAFHVFKVFVANPNKSPQVLSILLKNREKLAGYLANFQNDREDEQFSEVGWAVQLETRVERAWFQRFYFIIHITFIEPQGASHGELNQPSPCAGKYDGLL